MPRKASPLRDLQTQKAAYLRAQHKMSQEDIGQTLGGISQAHVSRLLSHAEKMGWLETELRFVSQGIADEVLEDIYQLLEPPELASAIRRIGQGNTSKIPNARVFDSGTDSATPEAMEIRRKRFGRAAAGRLMELLQSSEVVGVAWGKTISQLIEGMASQSALKYKQSIQFVPVCAELPGLAMPGYSSTRLAALLNELVNGEDWDEHFSLTGIPAYIPKRYEKEQAEMLWRYIVDISSYQKIFRNQFSFMARMDTLITSISAPALPMGGCISELLTAGGISAEDLNTLIVGDMGGVLIPRAGLNDKDKNRVDELNAMWTGVNYQHLRQIADESFRQPRKAGNIVIAVGQDKVPILTEVIRLGLANELLIDKSLATALEQSV